MVKSLANFICNELMKIYKEKSWKNSITEEYDYYLRKYEMEIVGYESKLDRFKKLLNVLKEVKDN